MTTITFICKRHFRSHLTPEQLEKIVESIQDEPIGKNLTDVMVTFNSGLQLHYMKESKRKRR